VSDCCLTPTPTIFQPCHGENKSICTRPTRLVGFLLCYSLKQQCVDRHVAPLGRIILIPSQPVCALSP